MFYPPRLTSQLTVTQSVTSISDSPLSTSSNAAISAAHSEQQPELTLTEEECDM